MRPGPVEVCEREILGEGWSMNRFEALAFSIMCLCVGFILGGFVATHTERKNANEAEVGFYEINNKTGVVTFRYGQKQE